MKLGDYVQSGDWKGEKHVPVIEAPERVKAGEAFNVEVSVGKEIPHPNTVEHHIKWIKLYYIPEGGKFAVELAFMSFDVHGESGDPAFTEPSGVAKVKLSKSGTLIAQEYCNIHGLWESARPIIVE